MKLPPLLLSAVLFTQPVRADIAQEAYVKASNPGLDDTFGAAVAIDGNTMVIGAPGESSTAAGGQGNNGAAAAGAVYVFVRSDGAWVQQAFLKAGNAGAGDLFGVTVAIDGDTLVIGAREEDSNSTTVNSGGTNNSALEAGAAYVFVRTGTTWTQEAYLKANNTGAGDQFGYSVAVSGETVAVSARYEDASSTVTDSGAVYVYTRSGGSWPLQARLRASNAGTNDYLGVSVAIDGDTVIAGAHQEDGAGTNAGAAYIFTRSGTAWSQQQILRATGGGAEDAFGAEVAISGNSVVIRAALEDGSATTVNGTVNNSATSAGAAYVFSRTGSTWSQQAYLKPSNTGAGDQFGRSLDIDGDTVCVGAPFEDSNATGFNGNPLDNSAADSGAAYIFTRTGTTWAQTAYLKASNTGAGDNFGNSSTVRVSGSLVVIGAPSEDSVNQGINGPGTDDSRSNSGAAYVFTVFPWRLREPVPVYADLQAVAAEDNEVVAVGAKGAIATSADGEIWQTVRAPHAYDYRGVAFGSDSWPSRRWVAVGGGYNRVLGQYEAAVAVAGEGDTGDWREYFANATAPLNAVSHHQGRFVAVGELAQSGAGYRAVYTTSTDGWNWSGGFTPSPARLFSIAGGNGVFVAVGGGGSQGPVVYRTSDGSTWTGGAVAGAGNASNALQWVDFQEGRFIATSTNGAVVVSTDGLSWQPVPAPSLPGGERPWRLVRATGRSVWFHNDLSYSDNDQTWLPQFGGTFANPYPQMAAAVFYNQAFVAVGSGGSIQRSPDAVQWTEVAGERTPGFSGGIAEKDGLWLAAGSYFAPRGLQASPDGIHWHAVANHPLSSVYDFKTALGRFVAVGRYGVFHTSADGFSWDHVNIPGWNGADRDLYTIASGGGVLLAAGQSEIGLLRSTDGLTCTRDMNPFPDITGWTVHQMAYGAGRFVAFGSGIRTASGGFTGFVFYSPDGVVWTESPLAPPPGLTVFIPRSVIYAAGRFAGIGQFEGYDVALTSLDGISWTTQSPNKGLDAVLVHDGKRFLASSYEGIYTSTDGLTWEPDAAGDGFTFWKAFHHHGLTVAAVQGRLFTQGVPSTTPPVAPQMLRELDPASTQNEGRRVVLSVTATGRPAPVFQWRRNGVTLTDGADYLGTATAELIIRSARTEHAGEYSVSAANSAGTAFSTVNHLLTIHPKQDQQITFNTPPAVTVNAAPFALNGTASSGLPVRYDSSNPAIATVRGGIVTLKGTTGTTQITAWQTGDAANWRAAVPVTRTLTVSAPSTEARLLGITLSHSPMLTPIFNSTQQFYTAPDLDAFTPLTVSASAWEPNAIITANGIPVPPTGWPASAPLPLNYGPNTLYIICTAQDGVTKRTYTVNLRKLTPIETWRRTHFGTPDQLGDAAEPADPDQDGLTNLVEFCFGLHPLTADAAALPVWTRQGDAFVFSFTRPESAGNVIYTGEWSTSLSGDPADWTPLPDTGMAPQLQFTAPVTGLQRMYLRVRVELSGPP